MSNEKTGGKAQGKPEKTELEHLVDEDASAEHLGRKTLGVLALGAVATGAFLLYQNSKPETAIPAKSDIVIEATTVHYAHAKGIGDGLQESGEAINPDLSNRLDQVDEILQMNRMPWNTQAVESVYFAGVFDALKGEWTQERLDQYIDRIDNMHMFLGENLIDDDTPEAVSGRIGATLAITGGSGFFPDIEENNSVLDEMWFRTSRLMQDTNKVSRGWAWPEQDAPENTGVALSF